MKSTHYSGKTDGNIKTYLKEMHVNGAVCPSFVGYEPFRQLWTLGLVTTDVTSVRLYFPDRQDEHYLVVDEIHLEGISLMAHSGQEGLHETEKILSDANLRYWEVSSLNPKAYRD